MDFGDGEPRPRVVLSRAGGTITAVEDSRVGAAHLAGCLGGTVAFAAAGFALLPSSSVLASIFFWVAASLLLAPFAPPWATGGPTAVGRGPALPDPDPSSSTPSPSIPRRHNRLRNPGKRDAALASDSVPEQLHHQYPSKIPGGDFDSSSGSSMRCDEHVQEEGILQTDSDSTEANAGSARAENPILEKDFDSKNATCEKASDGGASDTGHSWSNADDLALLKALKVLPKDATMRWEKIASSVPGKTKSECFNRVAELKRDYRKTNGKASQL